MPGLVSPAIEDYISAHTSPQKDLLHSLAQETEKKMDLPQMMSSAPSAEFLKILVAATKAKNILEIGLFTGMSALKMAEGLTSPEGKITSLEFSQEFIDFAKTFIDHSPYREQIHIIQGDAKILLQEHEDLQGPFDLCFIDANKTAYPDYYKLAMDRLVPGGLIIVDNCLWSGRVVDEEQKSSDKMTKKIDETNHLIQNDPHSCNVIVPLRDGMHIAIKK